MVLGAGLPLKSLRGLITVYPSGRRSNHLFIRDQRDCGGCAAGGGGNSSLGDSRKTRTLRLSQRGSAPHYMPAHTHTHVHERARLLPLIA